MCLYCAALEMTIEIGNNELNRQKKTTHKLVISLTSVSIITLRPRRHSWQESKEFLCSFSRRYNAGHHTKALSSLIIQRRDSTNYLSL